MQSDDTIATVSDNWSSFAEENEGRSCVSNTAHDEWLEVEIAIAKLNLFKQEQMPQLTHSLCPACYEQSMASLDQ